MNNSERETIKRKFKDFHKSCFKKRYEPTSKDRECVDKSVELLKKKDLPVNCYIEFIFLIVVPQWEKTDGRRDGLSIKSLCNKDIINMYSNYIKDMHYPKSSVESRLNEMINKEMEDRRPKVRLVKGTLPDDDKPAE